MSMKRCNWTGTVPGQILLDLTGSHTLPHIGNRDWPSHLAWLRSLTDSRSDPERRFLDRLQRGYHRLPDDAQREIPVPRCVPAFPHSPNASVVCDGTGHDKPTQSARNTACRHELVSRDYHVIAIRHDRPIEWADCGASGLVWCAEVVD